MPAPNGSAAGQKRRRPPSGIVEEADGNSDGGHQESNEEGPACLSCRKRKAKCSRQQPCWQCQRLGVECTYHYDERRRPGMKTGAVEALAQRLTSLEHMFIGQGLLLKPLLAHSASSSQTADGDAGGLSHQTENLKQHYLDTFAEGQDALAGGSDVTLRTNVEHAPMAPANASSPGLATDPPLPPDEVLDELVEWYFANIHRWIPILHVRQFREAYRNPAGRMSVSSVLLAIVSLCLRFSRTSTLGEAERTATGLRCRHAVILRGMERFSLQNLQALVVIAFDIIGSGRGPSAWSVVGSMARTVEQLRLNIEEPAGTTFDDSRKYLISRMTFLRQPRNWVEEEERRRVFWTVFIMDRFCSVATSWNNSLTGADVLRRLPCEGAIWEAGTPVNTPFFGLTRTSQAPDRSPAHTNERLPVEEDGVEHIGGFAFCVEATESLNLVTRFFLQHAVRFEEPQQVQLWLMQFKELDLRLVKWRLFLPEKWRNASVPNQDGVMDPNLTLAHITHNTAVIQLHQCIAFPSAQWRNCPVSLPSVSSADTCVTAASEIGTIARQFLQQNNGIINPQFSLCLFIAGRVLLAHSSFAAAPLHAAFDSISFSLLEIAREWDSASAEMRAGQNLASRLSRRLVETKHNLHPSGGAVDKAPTLDVGQPVYFEETDQSRAASVAPDETGVTDNVAHLHDNLFTDNSPESVSMAFPPMPFALEQFAAPQLESASGNIPLEPTGQDMYSDASFAPGMWDGLQFDDQYEQMLRVSTYSDTTIPQRGSFGV